MRPSRQAGLTLIEVVAAIAILGTVLVGIVLAQSRHTRQLAVAQRKAVAVDAADALIAEWWADRQSVPTDGSGVLPARPPMTWATRAIENESVAAMGGRVVRLEVRDTVPPPGDKSAAPPVLVEIDLIVPAESSDEDATADRAEGGGDG